MIDSSGLKVFGESEWLETKYGKQYQRKIWRKLHIDKDIYPYLEKEGSPSKIKIRLALKYYTQNVHYLKALINGTHRYDFRGSTN